VTRNGRPPGVEIILIVVVFSILVLTSYLIWLPSYGGAMLPDHYEVGQEILEEEIIRMEEKFNVTMPPIEIIMGNRTEEDNETAAYYCSSTIELLEPQYWSRDKYRHIIIHELGHHYLRSVCDLDCPNELPLRFEEAFVEGYSISETKVIWNHYEDFYNEFAYMPKEFFECGFESCDPLGCYQELMGREWT